eukprot:GEMP01048344.1.p1 GENE.GEMP01048344.1~~GEMP01048344.1.p1  ORF type:complete len:122 (+),score=0.86 GEMP01048344.1:18-383(+)
MQKIRKFFCLNYYFKSESECGRGAERTSHAWLHQNDNKFTKMAQPVLYYSSSRTIFYKAGNVNLHLRRDVRLAVCGGGPGSYVALQCSVRNGSYSYRNPLWVGVKSGPDIYQRCCATAAAG